MDRKRVRGGAPRATVGPDADRQITRSIREPAGVGRAPADGTRLQRVGAQAPAGSLFPSRTFLTERSDSRSVSLKPKK